MRVLLRTVSLLAVLVGLGAVQAQSFSASLYYEPWIAELLRQDAGLLDVLENDLLEVQAEASASRAGVTYRVTHAYMDSLRVAIFFTIGPVEQLSSFTLPRLRLNHPVAPSAFALRSLSTQRRGDTLVGYADFDYLLSFRSVDDPSSAWVDWQTLTSDPLQFLFVFEDGEALPIDIAVNEQPASGVLNRWFEGDWILPEDESDAVNGVQLWTAYYLVARSKTQAVICARGVSLHVASIEGQALAGGTREPRASLIVAFPDRLYEASINQQQPGWSCTTVLASTRFVFQEGVIFFRIDRIRSASGELFEGPWELVLAPV